MRRVTKVKGIVYVVLLAIIASATVFLIMNGSNQKVSAYEPPRVYEEIHLNDNSVIYVGDTGFTRTRTTTMRCPHCAMALFREMESSLADYAYVPGKYFDRFTVDNGNGRQEVVCWDTTPPPYVSGDTVSLYAEYNFETYHIKFPGTSFSTINCSYGDPLEMPQSPYENKYLLNWYITKYNSSSDVSMFKDSVLQSGSVPDLSPHEAATESTVDMTANLVDRYYTLSLDDSLGGKLTAKVEYNCNYVLPVPTSTGRIFKGWYSEPNGMGKQYTNAQGASLNKWTSASPVPLYADWDLIHYTITYVDAPGFSNEKFTVEDRIVLSTPSKLGYVFDYWWDGQARKMTEIPKGTTQNVTVFAKWIGKSYSLDDLPNLDPWPYKVASYTEENKGVVIININTSNSFILMINTTITNVTIIQNVGVTINNSWISTMESSDKLNLNLKSVDIVGGFVGGAPQIALGLSRPTNLTIYGTCFLRGGNGDRLNPAADAVKTNKALTITMTESSKITLRGGDGADGVEGMKGADGGRGNDGIYVDQRGKDGGNGIDGENGEDGKPGAMGLNLTGNNFTYIYASNARCIIMAGHGGNGGNGGNGGYGGDGGNGAWGALFSIAGAGGNGGKGGNGGRGGNGGAGGRACDQTLPDRIEVTRGYQGYGGDGGHGGRGGNAGLGGKYWTNNDYNSNGNIGAGGSGGAGGAGYYTGTDGKNGKDGIVPERT